jgi:stress response protein YsnF
LSDASSKQGVRASREDVISVVAEELHLTKQPVVTGRIRVRTTTNTVEEVARADLTSESVEVTRVPVGREVDQVPAIRTEDDVTIVPVVEEILVIEKRLVLKEELHIRRRIETEAVAVPVELRKQTATVERLSSEGQNLPDKEPNR